MYHVTSHEMVGSDFLGLVPPASQSDVSPKEMAPAPCREFGEDVDSSACGTSVAEVEPQSHEFTIRKPSFVKRPEHIEDARLREAVDYVHRHLEDPIGVQELINHVCVSRRWLEYAFRDEIGITPYQYIRLKRLEHAGELLAAEPLTKIYQVARRTGFTSAKQLTMAFRQHYGMSPREYRREVCFREPQLRGA